MTNPTPPAAASESCFEHGMSSCAMYPGCDCGRSHSIKPATEIQSAQPSGVALTLALRFHETYERLAPSFGYETRAETRQFDPESKNGRLMIAVCTELSDAPPIAQQGGGEDIPRVITGYADCTCVLPQYCDGYCQPIFSDAALASKADGGES